MIDTDKYGMTNEELLDTYSSLSVDDYKDLLAEVKRLREAIKVATMDLEEPNMHEETRKDLLDMFKEMIE